MALHPRSPVRLARTIGPFILGLLFAVAVISPISAAGSGGPPPAFGELCGHVHGATWHYKGQTGTRYNVTGTPGACKTALKSVGALTKRHRHNGALGAGTITGPRGYLCADTGVKRAHAGTCGNGKKHFLWAPHLK